MKSAPSIHSLMRSRLLAQAGILPATVVPRTSIQELEATQWSPEFERLMRNRLLMGSMRYGRLGSPSKTQYDRVSSMASRLSTYRASGNLELLVDVANLALVEFIEGRHPKRHWHATDDSAHVQPSAI